MMEFLLSCFICLICVICLLGGLTELYMYFVWGPRIPLVRDAAKILPSSYIEPLYTTLNAMRESVVLDRLLLKFGKSEPDDEPLSVISILEFCGPYAAIWALRTITGEDVRIRRFIIDLAREKANDYYHTHFWEGNRNGKNALNEAFRISQLYILGRATDADLKRARLNSCDALAYALTSLNPAEVIHKLVMNWEPNPTEWKYQRAYAGDEIYEQDLTCHKKMLSRLFYKHFSGVNAKDYKEVLKEMQRHEDD